MDNRTERDFRPVTNKTDEGDVVNEVVFQAISGLSIVIMLIGIPGNVLVIASISMNKHMRTAANFLVMSLSLFDFLFLSTVVPIHTYCFLTGWQPPPKVCWAVGFVTNWLLPCSVLTTGSIAINRYIVIVLKSKYRQISGNKAVFVTSTITFLFPCVLLSPSFEGSLGTFGFEKHDRNCGWAGPGIMKAITIVTVIIFPLGFMTLCYIWIVVYVVASRKRVGHLGQTARAPGNTSRNMETRLSQMLAMVYVVFVLTTLPTLVLNISAQMGVSVPASSLVIVFVVVWISTAANPVMYGLVNKKYRDAYKNVAVRIKSIASRPTETERVEVMAR